MESFVAYVASLTVTGQFCLILLPAFLSLVVAGHVLYMWLKAQDELEKKDATIEEFKQKEKKKFLPKVMTRNRFDFDNDCPICLEVIGHNGTASAVVCTVCQNGTHVSCIAQTRTIHPREFVGCPLCSSLCFILLSEHRHSD